MSWVSQSVSDEWIRNLVDSALTGYEHLLYRVEKGEVRRNRFGTHTKVSRRNRRLFSNQEWFKEKRKNKLTISKKTVSPPHAR